MPQQRPDGHRGYTRSEQTNPDMRLLFITGARSFKCVVKPHENEVDGEPPYVFMNIQKAIGNIDLSVMTTGEIEVMRRFFNEAFDLAQESTRILDQQAADNVNSKRNWRTDPRYLTFDNGVQADADISEELSLNVHTRTD